MFFYPRLLNTCLDSRNSKYQLFFHLSLFFAAVLLVYWRVYDFQFLIGWDDQWFVTNEYTEGGISWRNFYYILTDFYYGQYAPLNQLYYTFIYSLFGYDPAVYHLGNLLLHLANVMLVYRLFILVAPQLVNTPPFRIRQIAFLTAFLFAILPINVEPVAWTGASKVLLYAFCYLAALNCYCAYIIKLRSIYFVLTIIFFILSFGAKEQAVLLPLCLVLLDYVFLRDQKRTTVWLEKIPFILLSLLFGLITMNSQGIQEGEEGFYPVYQRLPLAMYTLVEYFTKCLVPINMSYLYPYPFEIGENAPWWIWLYVIGIPAVIYCFFDAFKKRWLFFGMMFFLIHIILVLNILPMARFSLIADRYAYVASIGLCFIVGYIVMNLSGKLLNDYKPIIFILVYGGALIAYSYRYTSDWRNANTLKSRLRETIELRHDYSEMIKYK